MSAEDEVQEVIKNLPPTSDDPKYPADVVTPEQRKLWDEFIGRLKEA